jgi:hypothetical protein
MSFEEELKRVLGTKVEDEATRTQLIADITRAQITSEQGLINKRDELLKETKGLKESLQATTVSLQAFGDITPSDIEKLKLSNEELLKNPNDAEKFTQQQKQFDLRLADQQAAATKQYDQFKTELAKKDAAFDALNGEINDGLKRRELSEALAKVGVAPKFQHDLIRSLLYDVTIDQVGDERKVKINIGGTPFDIIPGLELWSRDSNNEHYISATHNLGGGSTGSTGSVTLASIPFEEMTLTQKNQYAREDLNGFLAKKAAAGK